MKLDQSISLDQDSPTKLDPKRLDESLRTGVILRVNRDGFGFVEDSKSGSRYPFTVDKVLGYDGGNLETKGLRGGASVGFLLGDGHITQMEVVGEKEALYSLLTVPEVARELRVSERTIYSMIKRGELAHVKIGRLMRVPRRFLMQLLNPVNDIGDR